MSEPSRKQTISDFVPVIKSFFRERLCGILFAEIQPNLRPSFHVGSGFLIESHGLVFFVTAGHVFEQIASLLNRQVLLGPSLIVPSGPKSIEELGLTSEDLNVTRFSSEDTVDVGAMLVAPDLLAEFRRAGVKLLNRECCGTSVDKSGKPILVGYTANGARISDQVTLYTIENRVVKPRIKTQLGALPFQMIGLRNTATDSGLVYHATPDVSDLQSVEGMSGGFIVELYGGEQIRDYRWLGLQSSQTRVLRDGSDVVTGVKFVAAEVVLDLVDSFAEEISDDLRRWCQGNERDVT